MTTDRELMQQALDALERVWHSDRNIKHSEAIEALRARLAQPEQEPVATVYDAYDATGIDWHCKNAPATGTKLYTAPPQREWQGLTDEEMSALKHKIDWTAGWSYENFARAIEAKLKEKNG